MIRRKDEARSLERANLRGGEGTVLTHYLLEEEELLGKARFCAITTLEPGCSIGLHSHDSEAEIFYILEGTLEADDNGTATRLYPGDIMLTGGGHTHSVKNDTDKTARMLAIIMN